MKLLLFLGYTFNLILKNLRRAEGGIKEKKYLRGFWFISQKTYSTKKAAQ